MFIFKNAEQVIEVLRRDAELDRRNARRWDEGYTNGGRVDGIQGKLTKRECIAERERLLGSAIARENAVMMLEAISPSNWSMFTQHQFKHYEMAQEGPADVGVEITHDGTAYEDQEGIVFAAICLLVTEYADMVKDTPERILSIVAENVVDDGPILPTLRVPSQDS